MRSSDGSSDLCSSDLLMDEAERCHRLAILDRGALVADGTPRELTAQLEGRTFTVETDDPRAAQRALARVAGAPGVAQEIGRASCREGAWQYAEITVVHGHYKKKTGDNTNSNVV